MVTSPVTTKAIRSRPRLAWRQGLTHTPSLPPSARQGRRRLLYTALAQSERRRRRAAAAARTHNGFTESATSKASQTTSALGQILRGPDRKCTCKCFQSPSQASLGLTRSLRVTVSTPMTLRLPRPRTDNMPLGHQSPVRVRGRECDRLSGPVAIRVTPSHS